MNSLPIFNKLLPFEHKSTQIRPLLSSRRECQKDRKKPFFRPLSKMAKNPLKLPKFHKVFANLHKDFIKLYKFYNFFSKKVQKTPKKPSGQTFVPIETASGTKNPKNDQISVKTNTIYIRKVVKSRPNHHILSAAPDPPFCPFLAPRTPSWESGRPNPNNKRGPNRDNLW